LYFSFPNNRYGHAETLIAEATSLTGYPDVVDDIFLWEVVLPAF
jgi:hypothetical protein